MFRRARQKNLAGFRRSGLAGRVERWIHHCLIGLLSAGAGWFAWSLQVRGVDVGIVPWRFNNLVFVGVLVASIPATMLLVLPLRLLLARGNGRVLWIVNPARTVAHRTTESEETVVARARSRLEELGFSVETGDADAGQRLLFRKAKEKQVVQFSAHAFTGELTARREGSSTRVDATLVFEDTVVVETGEGERLQALARYLAGEAEDLKVATMPFTMVCGVVIALAQVALRPVAALEPWLVQHGLSLSLAAVGMIVLGGHPILRNRAENYGLSLGLLGLGAAVLPLLVR